MSRPLVAKIQRQRDAEDFHRRVFRKYGNLCWFGKRVGHPKKRAIDAAHILKKSHLGPLRYADERLARPLCRECHDLQEPGTNPRYRFSYADYKGAVLAHNAIPGVKSRIYLVDRKTYLGSAA